MRARRDAQRGRVYAWEDAEVAPHDTTTLPFAAAQAVVDALWSDSGLRYPPRVEPLPVQARTLLARADRLRIALPAAVPSWVLLHELAHAMTTEHDGASDGHGPVFLGVYVGLLARYLRLPREGLLRSLRDAGIAVQADAQPVFVDCGGPPALG